MANEEETMMTDLLQKNAIPFDDQGQQMYVYLHKILNQNSKTPVNFLRNPSRGFEAALDQVMTQKHDDKTV